MTVSALPALEQRHVSSPAATISTRMRILAYVHLRNIHNSTGAGRVTRQLTSHLAARPDVDLKVLADRNDHARIISQVGAPWTGYDYRLFARDTSRPMLIAGIGLSFSND